VINRLGASSGGSSEGRPPTTAWWREPTRTPEGGKQRPSYRFRADSASLAHTGGKLYRRCAPCLRSVLYVMGAHLSTIGLGLSSAGLLFGSILLGGSTVGTIQDNHYLRRE